MIGIFNYGTGRRKSAVARVFMKAGKGAIVVNGKPVDEFFARTTSKASTSWSALLAVVSPAKLAQFVMASHAH